MRYITIEEGIVKCIAFTFKLPLTNYYIKENANFIYLSSQNLKNVNHICNDLISTDIPKEEFRKLCENREVVRANL